MAWPPALRSWPLGRRSGRFLPWPCPPPRSACVAASECGGRQSTGQGRCLLRGFFAGLEDEVRLGIHFVC